MTQRSPYNDRYKTEQKGKTRRSASSAKPKRELGEAGSSPSSKPAKRPGRARPQRPQAPAIEATPKMRQLRRVWWVLWVLSLVIALAIVLMQREGGMWKPYIPFAWGIWAGTMAGAFFLEFGPIRKARAAAWEAQKSKPSKKDKPAPEKKTGGDRPDDAE